MKTEQPLKVIIFEDEFLLANDLKQQIQKYNYEVTAIFRKAEDGLQHMAAMLQPEDYPDLVMMDISLAGKMTGIEAAEVITNRYHCALVFLTGMSQNWVFEEAFKTKPHAYLIKPFDINQAIVSMKLAIYQNSLEKRLLLHQAELEVRVLERTNELIEARDTAMEAVKLKNTLLANISTQIREPLLGLMGMVTLLKEATRNDPDLQRYTAYIDDNVAHVFSLLHKILELKDYH